MGHDSCGHICSQPLRGVHRVNATQAGIATTEAEVAKAENTATFFLTIT